MTVFFASRTKSRLETSGKPAGNYRTTFFLGPGKVTRLQIVLLLAPFSGNHTFHLDLLYTGWQPWDMTRHIIQQANETSDGRRTATAALRNVDPIVDILRLRLPAQGCVLEVASGTGQHVAAFAKAFPALDWVPSDVDADQRRSIAAWQMKSGLSNVADPLAIDVGAPWPVAPGFAQVVLTINLLHLIPDHFVTRLFQQARTALSSHGRIIIYGPFLRGQDYASDGDQSFDTSLRAHDPAIGYKSVEAVH